MTKVKPLKTCCGKFHFRAGGPEFEVADADAKALAADGAVEIVKQPDPKKETKATPKVSPKKE